MSLQGERFSDTLLSDCFVELEVRRTRDQYYSLTKLGLGSRDQHNSENWDVINFSLRIQS